MGPARRAGQCLRAGAAARQILRRDSICLDVGAHRGAFLRQFLEFAPDGHHWAFEPIPAMAAWLRQQFPTIAVHDCALWDQDAPATFQFVPELPGWSGVRPQPYPVPTRPQAIPVMLRRLDGMLPSDLPVAFVKIDVEGGELEVLRGAEEMLRRCRPVVFFECAKIHHAAYATMPQDVHALFARCGLGVYLLDQTPLTAGAFAGAYEASHRSGYDRTAWGNYLAMPARS